MATVGHVVEVVVLLALLPNAASLLFDTNQTFDENILGFIDPCVPNPCNNSGRCVGVALTFVCECPANFSGKHCETDISSACIPNPCKNNNPCVEDEDEDDGYICECKDRYDGRLCERAVKPCSKRPCTRGWCRNSKSSYFCICPRGYKGRKCGVLNPCSRHPCRNRGKCSGSGSTYTCSCVRGYTGQNCELDVNECASSPCQNGGTCYNRRGKFVCRCRAGFTGKNCEKDHNPCKRKLCHSPGTKLCTPKGWRFTCTCYKGIWGRRCWHLPNHLLLTTVSNRIITMYEYGYKLADSPGSILFSVQACKNAILFLAVNDSFDFGVYNVRLGFRDNTAAAITKITRVTKDKPKTCAEVVSFKLGSTDGEYWLYPVGVYGQKVRIYCHNMTSHPTEYVTLMNVNDGVYSNLQNLECEGQDVETDIVNWGSSNFSKIRVDVATMEVIREDYTFARVSHTAIPYGEAGDCYTSHDDNTMATCGVKGFFKIDLNGTGLLVDENLAWTDTGDDTYFEVDKSADRTVINIRCGGHCGRCAPVAPMYLKINPQEEYSDAILLSEESVASVDCNLALQYWVSWEDGTSIAVGRGNLVGKDTIVTATDLSLMDINYLALGTEGTTGYWKIDPCHCLAGKCRVWSGKYRCSCPYGYSGRFCENAPRLLVKITPEGEIVEVKGEAEEELKNETEVLTARLEANDAKLNARVKLDENAAIKKNTALIAVVTLDKPVDFGPDSTKGVDIDAVLGIKPGRKKRSIHKRQAPGQKRVIEVLLVVDYAICQFWVNWVGGDEAAAMQEVKDYYTSMLYTIGQRLKSLTSMNVELWLARLIIANSVNASSWTTATEVNGTVDTVTALMAFTRWIYDNMAFLPKHDHAMLLSGFDLSLSGNKNSAGRAWDCRMCQLHSVSVVEETYSQTMAVIAAHELGHSLCSDHDGDGNSCGAEDRHPMAGTVKIPPQDKKSHPWVFSDCTVTAIQTYLTGDHGGCTLENNAKDSGLGAYMSTPLGSKYAHDLQCELAMGDLSALCRMLYYNNPNGGYRSLCHNMLCSKAGSDYCFPILSQDGTPCGNFKWCQQGQCVENKTHGPDVYDRCPAGDDPNTNCKKAGICNSFIFSDVLCCKTCLDAAAGAAQTNAPTTTVEMLPMGPPVTTFPDTLCPAALNWLYTGNDWMLKWSCPIRQEKQERLGRQGNNTG